jgi:MoaA/NifB/PqqE/SkfB family radical SAM enzyme
MNSSFTPLKTYQGISIEELKTLINERDIYIWGCGHLGRIIKRCLEKNELSIKSFCDSDPKLNAFFIDNVKVISPQDVINYARSKQAFIIIASMRYRDEIEESCISAGLVKKEDFLSYIHISRPEVAIDVAGKCNIKCPSCPMGNMENLLPAGYMPAYIYKQVLNKLLLELPLLMNIDLSSWGEPFMNPELAEIIQMTETMIPCTVSTNLQISDKLEDVIKAQPSQLIVSTSGYGKSYEINHAGASWQVFFDNIHLLKELIDKYKPKSQITVLYHLYRNNQQQDLDNLRSLCLKLGLKFSTTWAYLNPYDKILDFCEGRDVGTQAQKVLDVLSWDLMHSLKLSKTEAQDPCLCQRIFPIINWDLSVSLCHIYYYPIISNNFLDTPLDEILKLRHTQSQCVICQKHGLHRLDIEILLKKYPKDKILLQ